MHEWLVSVWCEETIKCLELRITLANVWIEKYVTKLCERIKNNWYPGTNHLENPMKNIKTMLIRLPISTQYELTQLRQHNLNQWMVVGLRLMHAYLWPHYT